jgi:hypothetical protein
VLTESAELYILLLEFRGYKSNQNANPECTTKPQLQVASARENSAKPGMRAVHLGTKLRRHVTRVLGNRKQKRRANV